MLLHLERFTQERRLAVLWSCMDRVRHPSIKHRVSVSGRVCPTEDLVSHRQPQWDTSLNIADKEGES